jgi:hypothetical protein
VPGIVVSFPVSQRRATTADALGNRFGVVRTVIPGAGDRVERLRRVAVATEAGKRSAMQPWVGAVASAVVRGTVRLGLYHRYMRRQRYLHTVVTNLHGPDVRTSFCGAPVVEVVPLAVGGGGNVTATFAALSYAGTLAVTMTVDPERWPDLARAAAVLQAELGTLPDAERYAAGRR